MGAEEFDKSRSDVCSLEMPILYKMSHNTTPFNQAFAILSLRSTYLFTSISTTNPQHGATRPNFHADTPKVDDQFTLQATLQATLQQEVKAKSIQRLNLSDTKRRRILDVPNAETEEKNIAASSSSTKQGLLARAAHSPDQLSQSEIQLLMHRYWAEVTVGESMARLGRSMLGSDDASKVKLRLECVRMRRMRKRHSRMQEMRIGGVGERSPSER